MNPDDVSDASHKLIVKAGLPHLTLHGLRHCHAALLLSAGVHAKVVSERLGHSNIAITLDVYSHVLPHVQEDAANKIDAQLRSFDNNRSPTIPIADQGHDDSRR